MRSWTPLNAARRALEILCRDDFTTLFFKVLGETFYRRIWLFERLLDEPIRPASVDGLVDFGSLHPNEIGRCIQIRPGLSANEIKDRLQQGQCCYVARNCGQVIAQVWVTQHQAFIEYLEDDLYLATGEYYLYELTVIPRMRGKRIATGLFTHAYRELHKTHGKRAIFAVNLDNQAGIRALSSNGAKRFALQGYVGRGRYRYRFCRDLKA